MTASDHPIILVVDDEPRFLQLYAETLKAAGYQPEVAQNADDALKSLQQNDVKMLISDLRMPGTDGLELLRNVRRLHEDIPVLLVTAYSDVRSAVKALKLGAVDYLSKPVDLDELVTAVNDALDRSSSSSFLPEIPAERRKNIVAESPVMQTVLRDAFRVAKSDATILLTGESGVGKNVIAEFIHASSTRSSKKLVHLNCGAIAENLIASELFGHEKGAFTGAQATRKGRFREADGGTLFLDEIGDLPLSLQPSLLTAIETGRISPVGSDKEKQSDVRLIAATNHDLEQEVEAGTFRKDLFYRINVISLRLPPLRERREDILPLCRKIMRDEAPNLRLSPGVQRLLCRYDWPGNIRELSNAMQRAALLANDDVVVAEHLPPAILQAEKKPGDTSDDQSLINLERQAILKALEQHNGNRTRTALALGLSRRALLYKIKRYELD